MEPAVVIVTGASLEAEVHDRPLAYVLRGRIAEGLSTRDATGEAVVCSDVWYLNQPGLRSRPTISVGPPDRNALTASLADRLPSLFAIDHELIVQGDPEWVDIVACCWGSGPEGTQRAVGAFIERCMDDFLDAAASTE